MALLLLGGSAYAAAPQPSPNDFFFDALDFKVENGSGFDVTGHAITNGQTFGGVNVNVDTGTLNDIHIVVSASRENSAPVADWFRNLVDAGGAIASITSAKFPSALNFAVSGDLTLKAGAITAVCKGVVIAQGHTWLIRNNWWVGGLSMKRQDGDYPTLVQKCDGGTIKVEPAGLGANVFNLYLSGP